MQVRSGLLRDELLEQLDALAELVDDLEVLVDHRVEQRVEKQTTGRETTLDEALLDESPGREITLVNGDDRVLRDEDRDLVVADDVRARRLECIKDDEVMRLVLIDLRSLVAVPGVLHGERVKLKLFRDEIELLALGVRDVEPARVLAAKLGQLVRGPIDDRVSLFDEKARRHVRSMRGRSGSETANDADELLRVEGLREIRLGIAAIGLATGIRDAREDHEWDAAERHAELARERWTVHPRHLHVQDNDRGRILLDDAECLGAIARLDDAEAVLGEKLMLDGERLDIVIDDQHGARPRNHAERHADLYAYGVP